MKKSDQITFDSLLQDEEFLKLAKSQDSRLVLEEFIMQYPDKRETIIQIFDFLRENMADEKVLSLAEIVRMRNGIFDHLEKHEHQRFGRNLFTTWSRIAAACLILISFLYFSYYYSTDNTLERIAQAEISAGEDAVIVLSDGSTHNLSSKESAIEYSADGTEIIVKDHQLESEKLANVQAEEGLAVNQIVVPFGHRHSIVLSDGTKVQLNSGSQLVFPADFKGNTREVFLKGEGYFEVTKNKGKPFVVKTKFVDLKVTGTSLNISSYQDEQIVTTVLVEGRVAVYGNKRLFGGSKVELKPGQGCFYSVENSNSVVKEVDVNDFISWKDGLFLFKDQELVDVVNRVKKYYNKNIQIEGSELSHTLISGKLVLTEEFEKVMNNLTLTLEASYEKDDGNTYKIRK